jgi:hypothetical protein
MERIVKNKPIRIEFGDYDNFATMTPLEILKYEPDGYYKVLIRWQYPNSEQTIDLWERNDKNVDFDSFKE